MFVHQLLRRQLRRHALDPDSLPEPVRELLDAIGEAYEQADDDRRLLERSLELTSRELMQRNRELRADIEARRRAEQSVREQEARTRAILAALPDVMVVVSPQGSVRELHVPEPTLVTGNPAERIGRPLVEVFPPELVAALEPAIAAARRERRAQQLDLSLTIAGKRRSYEARITVSGVGDIVIVIRDQTERLQMTERLRVADRMASVGILAAGVAHELNNPLAYVLGNLELLEQQVAGDRRDPEAASLVEDALDGARRMRAITQDLRTFSRPHPETVESIDPQAVMDSALRMAATEIRHRARLHRDYGRVPSVLAESGKLGQVFLNLVVNAVQALPVGDASGHQIDVRTATDGEGWAIIEVGDTGPGIPPHLRSRIFEPFVTTKPRGEGTGLGLSICHNIVTSLGGRITVHPRSPHGTTFRVALPPSDQLVRARARITANLPAIDDHDRPRRLLVIDDDALVAGTLRRVLARYGEVVVAHSGREGLHALRDGPRFDVVLCDLMMPEISGMDLFESLEDEDPELTTRFVFMTGGAFTERARAFLERVPNPRLDKPFEAADIHALMQEPG